jgi:hypothetical protein
VSDFREVVISYLGDLSDEELAGVFYEAMKKKDVRNRYPDGTFWDQVYVIGIASWTEDSRPEIEILATAFDPVPAAVEGIAKLGANQSGVCPCCCTLLASTMKSARCPICGTQVGCT